MLRYHVAWKSAITGNVIVGRAWWDTFAAAQENADFCIDRFAVLVADREPGKPSHWVELVDHTETAVSE